MKKNWLYASALFLILGLLYLNSKALFNETEEIDLSEFEEIAEEIEEEPKLYGININDLDVIEGVVGRNQTLGSILAPFNVPYQIIDEIARKSVEVFDVRKIAFNKKFTVLTPKDSSQAQFFIYEPNPVEYVVFKLDEPVVYKEERPVEIRTVEFGGLINTSLYQDMLDLGASHDLINKFADLYGWNVDFQRVPKGDKFKVVYREKVVDDIVVGFDGLETAFYEHHGKAYHAIPFEQNGELAFFNEAGDSFKKEFLRDPVEYTRISSKYNLNRYHPVQKRYKPHLGTDYAAKTGTPIRTIGDGTVVEARFTSANGNYVKIKHNGTYSTQYLHMSKIASGMKPGVRVQQGQVIGYVGSTGLATGPHLCFRFWKNGKQVDWLKEEIPPSDPISSENRAAFERVKMERLQQLAAIPYSDPHRLLANLEE